MNHTYKRVFNTLTEQLLENQPLPQTVTLGFDAIEESAKIGRRTIPKALEWLKNNGYIEIHRFKPLKGYPRKNRYTILKTEAGI